MVIQFNGGPLDGVRFDHAQGIDKVLLITDRGALIRYECGFLETANSYEVCQLEPTPAPAEFDFELTSSMRRTGSFF